MAFSTSAMVAAAAVGSLAAAGASIYSSMQQPSKPDVSMPKPPKQEDAQKKAELAARKRQKAISQNKSIYTTPLGVEDEADIARKTLLGQ